MANRLAALVLVAAGTVATTLAHSQTTPNAAGVGAAQSSTLGVATKNTVTRQTTIDTATSERTGSEDTLIQQGRTWGLSTEEIARAQVLLRGLRGAFSVPNLSPIEALGIHARTPAERQRYAELFARLHHDDVERVLAWQQAYDEAVRRLYPNEPVIAFTSTDPKVEISPAVAAAAAVPMSAIRPAASRRAAPPAKDTKEAKEAR
jgi:hypothetical protein